MNEIKELLDSGRQYTFDEGLSLVKKYDTNPGVISFLEQRRDMKHLGYELGRLSRFPRLVPVPGYHNAETVQPLQTEPSQASGPVKSASDSADDDGHEIVRWEDLEKRHQNTKYDDMPTDYLKEIYKQNTELYKELQYAHSQMKLANSDSGRAEWRSKLLDLDKTIRDNWKIIDNEIARLKDEGGQQHGGDGDTFKESTCRSYISRKLKRKTPLTAEDIVEMRKRVEQLVAHKCEFTPEVEQRLKELKVL